VSFVIFHFVLQYIFSLRADYLCAIALPDGTDRYDKAQADTQAQSAENASERVADAQHKQVAAAESRLSTAACPVLPSCWCQSSFHLVFGELCVSHRPSRKLLLSARDVHRCADSFGDDRGRCCSAGCSSAGRSARCRNLLCRAARLTRLARSATCAAATGITSSSDHSHSLALLRDEIQALRALGRVLTAE